ncbi:hypothetical protein K227x_01010 [Rubripirellula lacrimiformis]|uniref:Uncharacterized protein n=1 Tax=Rubripirellula lacrimiformis TaxID=1930273 RepID=A0A517N3M8_9BACT|nr:hypothetical protein [Rubripirellula lacrimiformis]QDT01734.1 hypothetical protein K227x_01010 [Rubripirellula lacrimiformis]
MSTDHANESPSDTGFGATDNSYLVTPAFGVSASAEVSSVADAEPKSESADAPNSSSGSDAGGAVGHIPTGNDATAIDAIEFRVIRPGSPVRRLRLTGSRYTFGSAEGCSIRLSDSALRPMHAVLIRDAVRVLVRAYSVPIEVNGTRKTEASLGVGDVMCLGTYQFELISISSASVHSTGQAFAPAPHSILDSELQNSASAGHSADGLHRSAENRSSAARSARPELPSPEDVIWRERLRREIDQWRERQVECDQREQRCDERESHLRGRETELWSRAENLYRRESRLQTQESAVMNLHDDYMVRQQELVEARQLATSHEDELKRRESEFQLQELEYRKKLELASRQLLQSQTQAESATQAVARMREQFESLNRQIDELSMQQRELSDHEVRQNDEHQRLRDEMQVQRDQAIDAQAESEALRRIAEARIEEMEAQLEELKSGASDAEFHQAELDSSERLIEELRTQVQQLQTAVAEASEESARLRSDYEEACESVRQLESLVAESNQRGDLDRESWMSEADELRAAIDQLTIDLAQANGEVSEMRDANEALTIRLGVVQGERDEAQLRPTVEDFTSLRYELDAANDKLSEMKKEYENTLSRLAKVEESSKAAPSGLNDSTSLPVASAIGAGLLGIAVSDRDVEILSDEVAEVQHDVNQVIQSQDVSDADSSAAAVDPANDPSGIDETNDSHSLESNQPPSALSNDDEDDVWPTYHVSTPDASDQVDDDASESRSLTSDDWESPIDAPESTVSDSLDVDPAQVQLPSIWQDEDASSQSMQTPFTNIQEPGFLATNEPGVVSSAGPGFIVPDDDVPAESPMQWGEAAWSADSDSDSVDDDDQQSSSDPWSDSNSSAASVETDDAADVTSSHWNDSSSPTDDDDVSEDIRGVADLGESGFQIADSETPNPWASSELNFDQQDADAAVDSDPADSVAAESNLPGLLFQNDSNDSLDLDSDLNSHSDVESDDQPISGSLASMLIKDLESDTGSDSIQTDDVDVEQSFEGTYVMPTTDEGREEASASWKPADESQAWDREYDEEAYSSEFDEQDSDDDSDIVLAESDQDYDPTEMVFDRFTDQDESSDNSVDLSDHQRPWDRTEDESESVDAVPSDHLDDHGDSASMGQYESEDDGDELEAELPVSDTSQTMSANETTSVSGAEDDDDSIEAYMNRLLNRVQGNPGGEEASKPSTLSLSTSVPSAVSELDVDTGGAEAVVEVIDPDAPLVPRSHAPERNSDLSAMRDLANQSARTAISHSARIQTRNIQVAGVCNLAVAAVAVIAALAVSVMLEGGLLYIAWVMALIIAGVSVRDAKNNFSEARRRAETSGSSDDDDSSDKPEVIGS